ncbi:AraC-like DNA-binding protein [Amorphus suaedae]
MGAVTFDGPTISGEPLPLIAKAFGANRIDAVRAFEACGLGAAATLTPPADAIPLAQFARLMQCAGEPGDDHARLWTSGRAIAGPSLTQLFPGAGAEHRLGTLLSRLATELDALQHGSDFRLGVEGDLCTLTYRIVDPRIWPRSRDAEFTLGFFDGVIRRAIGAGDFLEAVAFEHRRDTGADIARLTRVPPIFEEPVNLIAFPASLLDRPVDTGVWTAPADPAPVRRVRARSGAAAPAGQQASGGSEPPPRVARASADGTRRRPASERTAADPEPDVATAIYRRLGRGPLTQRDIARDCGLSDRSLRRHLRTRGLSFRALAEDARIDYAEWALAATDLPLAEIAFRAGYTDQSAFSRAFRRRTGMAPRQRRGPNAADPGGSI